MATDVTVNEATWEIPTQTPESTTYTAVVIWDGTSYVALCRELDLSSFGDSAGEAFVSLQTAVREAAAVANEKGIAAGVPVSDADMVEFLSHRKGSIPIAGYVFPA
jgi:hypothetical protein